MSAATATAKSYFGRLSDRYRDAYVIAAGTVRFGNWVKIGGLILGGLIALITLYASISYGTYSGRVYVRWYELGMGFFMAVVVVASAYISGTFLAAQGQFMNALLDIAVNTSPHLQNPEKAAIMTL